MANAYLALVSPIADAGVAHFLDTDVAYTSGKLQSWRSNGVEAASIEWDGQLIVSATGIQFGTDVTISRNAANRLALASGDNFQLLQGSIFFKDDQSIRWGDGDPDTSIEGNDSNGTLVMKSGGNVVFISDSTGLTSSRFGHEFTNNAEGNTGALTRKTARQVVAMGTGSTAVSTSISVPSGARLLAVGLNVDVAVVTAGDNTWEAAFSTGSTTAIAAAGTAAAQNTKITKVLADDEVTSGIAEITFTPNGATFTSGNIEAVVWYEELTALANA